MSIVQPILSTDQITDIVNYVNAYRAKNQAPPLVWNPYIVGFSQNWSYYLISQNVFIHSGTPLYGENLAYFQGYGVNPMMLIKKSIDAWYNEIDLYNFNQPGFSKETGHFTCLVWKASTDFGMGISINTTTGAADITMNTTPPGNVIGQFEQNVLPLVSVPPSSVPPSSVPTQYQSIINKLNKAITNITLKKSNYFITSQINSAIQSLYNTRLSHYAKAKIINALYNINYMVQKKQNTTIIINSIQLIIQELL